MTYLITYESKMSGSDHQAIRGDRSAAEDFALAAAEDGDTDIRIWKLVGEVKNTIAIVDPEGGKA